MNNIRTFMDISPPVISAREGKENTKKPKSVAMLSLAQFSRPPHITFGTVKLGTTSSEVLCIENPIDDATDVEVDRIASTKGFSVEQTHFIIPPEDSVCLTIHWTPVEEGNVRELVTFIAKGIIKHQAILLGRAEAPKRRKKSLWDAIKKKKASNVSTPVSSSLKKAANKTFRVPQQPKCKTERVQSPLRSCNDELVLHERVAGLTGSIENQQDRLEEENRRVLSERTNIRLAQTRLEGVASQKISPVVLLVPAAKLFDSEEGPSGVGTPCITDQKNVNRVLNMTLSPICTPGAGVSTLIPRIHSSQSPINCEGEVFSCLSQPFFPGSPGLSVKDALVVIQSDLIELDGASPPNACSSFDFSDSLESVREKSGADQSPFSPELTEQRVQEISTELEAEKPRLTFLVVPKTDQVKSCENEANHVVPLNFRKLPFSSSTVTKSRSHPYQESGETIRKTKTSKRRLLEKTLELSENRSAKSSLLGQQLVTGLPVIDTDGSHDSHDSIHSPLVAMPPEFFSPVRCAHGDNVTVSHPLSVAQLDLSPIMATPSCESLTSVKSDLTVLLSVQHQSVVTSLLPQREKTLVDPRSSVAVPARSPSRRKKRKSDEFLADETEKGKPFQVKRSRMLLAAKQTKKTLQDRKLSSRSESLRRKTWASQSSNPAPSAATKAEKSVRVAQIKLPSSKPEPWSLKSFPSSSMRTSKVVAVAQAKLTFIKPAQTVIPRHPLPFAAKNMFFDERWIEKQERGFVWWINYVLTPDDFKVSTEVKKVNALSLSMASNSSKLPKAPTKEEVSFRMYTARRRLNSLRRAACKFFTSEAMVKAIQRLELEVEARRLLVRKDRHLWKDIGERQKILTWLLSYNPLWLRIGLETIFGELIPLESNSDVTGLAVFILNRLLWNPDIAVEFRHLKVPHLYRDGHEEALSRFTLKKILLLVCFLDKAKESRMIQHDPCLFCVGAEFKTSKDLLLAFARDFLSGEGILSRHLGYLGLAVTHAQVPLDEFNFGVKNLAIDLRCGIRLVRVMELFTQDWSLSRKLRMPAVSRLQKVHNVELALDVLKAKGVDMKDVHGCAIEARDIVDGHREKTLALVWKIIFTFQIDVLLDEDQLKEEICFLKKTWRTREKLNALRACQDVAEKPKEESPSFQHSNMKTKLLMDWVNAVSAFYDSKAENFTVSFSDGQILCFLIHHYHPSHLPLGAVCRKTTQTVECSQQGRVGLNCSSSDSDGSFDTLPGQQNEAGTGACVDFTELLDNEKRNFQLVDTAVSYLGGVPAMLHTADMSNTIPNEKVVMSYLSFLCARLLDLRNETRAARIIQGAWRKYRLIMELKHYKESYTAATTIQSAVKRFLQRRRKERQNRAAIVIQTGWRSYSARRELRQLQMEKQRTLQISAAIVLQAQWRKCLAVKRFQRLEHCTVMMQARWRMKRAVTAYRRILWAARTIQKSRRACLLAKDERAATVIQRAFRKWQERRLAQKNVAAIKIQSWYRMVKCQKLYKNILQKTINIQAWCRGYLARRKFQFLKQLYSSTITIQRGFRKRVLRKRFVEMRRAAVVIQRWFRACRQKESERQRYLEKKRAAIILQAAFRGYSVRRENEEQWRASVVIQKAFRMFVARKGFLSLRKAALAVQQRYRAVLLGRRLRKEYLDRRRSLVALQALWRGRAVRKKIEGMHKAALLVQSCYRGYSARSEFVLKRRAALTIQNRYRAHRLGRSARSHYLRLRKSAVFLQALLRGWRARQELRERHRAAALIQATMTAFSCRQRFLSLKSAATVLQRHYQAHLLARSHQRQYSLMRQTTIRMQAVYRGSKERKRIRRMHEAATTIQACFRRQKAQVAFAAARFAASVIQQRYRAYVQGSQERRNYLKIRDSVVVMQSAYRGMKVRQQVQEMHRSATVIQAHYRRHLLVVRFQRLRWAATVVGQRFRANQERAVQISKYSAMKKSAVCIQSAYRGMSTRKQVKMMQETARVIQLRYTAYRERKRYLAVRSAAIQIQLRYRALIVARLEQKRYCSLRASVITVQSMYRGMKVRREVQRRRNAATVIQAAFHVYRARMAFKAGRLATTIIQRQYRAHLWRKRDRERFLKLRHSAIVIQSAFRGIKTRREMRKMHSAATVIQSQFRMHQCRGRFKRIRWAAIAVQERYRARDSLMQQYASKKTAALVIQRAFRGHRIRRQFIAMHQAATVIQRSFRAFRDRQRFLSLRTSALLVQQRYRALVAMKTQRERFTRQRRSAIILQSAFRGMMVRRLLQMEHRAAVTIQARVRGHLAISRYRRLQWAAKVVLQHFRARQTMKAEVQYLKEKMAATTLQAAFRGMQARNRVREMQKAASAIQRRFRTYRARRKYLSLKTSVIAVQQRYRSVLATRQQKERYHLVRSATITLQAAYRGYKARKEIKRRHAAATVLQAQFRRHRGVVTFRAMRLAVVIIQRHYKAIKQRKADREKFLMLRRSVITIQAAFRGQIARRHIAQMHKAAVLIQSSYKMHRQHAVFQRMRWAAAVLQQKFRARKLRDSQVVSYQQMKKAAVCIQNSFRRKLARELLKRERAAVKVQSLLRMCAPRRRFLQQKAASVVIQSAFRGYRARVGYVKMRAASMQIQRWYRSCRLAHKQRAEYLAFMRAAVTLQSAFRGVLAKRLVARSRAAVKIQSVLRMVWHRKRFLNLRSSALKVQCHYRVWAARRRFLSYRAAAVTLQKHFRALRLMKDQRVAYVNTLKSVVTLQAALRGHIEYRNFQSLKRSAVTIQAAFRGRQARRHAKRLQAALKIQAWFRGNVARQKFNARKKAIATVHRCMQTRLQRNRFQRVRQSVCIIQRRWRETLNTRQTRHDFLKMRSSTVKIQALWRGHIVRLNLRKLEVEAQVKRRCHFTAAVFHHLCAIRIQRGLRAHWALKSAQRRLHHVIYIQRWIKAKLQRKRYLEEMTKIIKVQRAARGWLSRRNAAAVVIQRAVMKYLSKKREERAQRGIINAQALWRGHRSRKANDTAEVIAMRGRLRKVNQGVKEEDRLCNKTTLALDYLLRYNHFSYILAALKNLETATRLSPVCCERLVNSGATCVIFTLIRSCNRSVPCMEVISFAVQVLLNLSKYYKTTEAVYAVENSVDTLLDLLQIYREKAGDKMANKGGSIFTKTCFLLAILLQDDQRALEFRNLPRASDRIHSLCSLTARKHNMDAERTVTKQKMNMSLYTPRKAKARPRIAPEWVLRQDAFEEVVDPLRAIQMVADVFTRF